MLSHALTILYVDNPPASADFYTGLLGVEPAESSPTFAMFAAPAGAGIGLWSRHTVEPDATPVGGSELAFMVDDVDAVHAGWVARGLEIVQDPVDLDFGRTFVALDPDGHRLRVFKPGLA